MIRKVPMVCREQGSCSERVRGRARHGSCQPREGVRPAASFAGGAFEVAFRGVETEAEGEGGARRCWTVGGAGPSSWASWLGGLWWAE